MSDIPPPHHQPLSLDHNQPARDSEHEDRLETIVRGDAAVWRSAAPAAEPFAARMRAALSAIAASQPSTASPASSALDTAPERHAGHDAGHTLAGTPPPDPSAGPRRRGLLAIAAMAAVVILLAGLLQLVGPRRGGPSAHPTPAVPPFPTTGLVAPTSLTGTPPHVSSTTSCDFTAQWRAPDNNIWLNDMAMVSPDEGWAVGALEGDPRRNPGMQPQGVIFHYTGGQWQRLPQTYPGVEISTLSMDSPTDGWAAADSIGNGQDTKAFILHYTGGQWQRADIPTLDRIVSGLPGSSLLGTSIRMFSPSDGWLSAETNTPRNPSDPASRSVFVVLRYQNGVWTPLPMPTLADTTELFQLSAVSADEAWVVGTDYGADLRTLFLHYAHGQWTTYPQTFPGVTEQLTMVDSAEGWAFSDPTVLHYDGQSWKPFALPAHLASLSIVLTGAVYPVAPGITWFSAAFNTQSSASVPSLILQEANDQWQAIAWPDPNVFPQRIISPASGELQVIGDFPHIEGCAPALVSSIAQGVFLRFHNGRWSESVLP